MEKFTMSRKEREQLYVMKLTKEGKISKQEGAKRLKMSVQQLARKYKRFLQEGDKGLIHRSRSRTSKRRWGGPQKAFALELLKSDLWKGFGPTFVSQKLKEVHGITVSKETIRKVMIQEGLWKGKKQKVSQRQRRQRRAMFGVMIQLDGSHHPWFEKRGDKCTLLVFIDDATSKLVWLEFAPSESRLSVLQATKNYIMAYGIPHEFYVDCGSVFRINMNNQDRSKITSWERSLRELDIEIHHALSPQAKGRVERAHKTLQDRLVNELRLSGISTIEDANSFLHTSNFIDKYNNAFAVQPLEKGDAHRRSEQELLDQVFRIREKRTLKNDYTIEYKKQILQLERNQKAVIRPKDEVTVETLLNGTIELSVRGIKLMFKEISIRPKIEKSCEVRQHKPHKPSENSKRWVSGFPPIRNKQLAEERVG